MSFRCVWLAFSFLYKQSSSSQESKYLAGFRGGNIDFADRSDSKTPRLTKVIIGEGEGSVLHVEMPIESAF